jgi:hypothetical protein
LATYMWTRNGSLCLNNISNLIKYSETQVRLKYGACGIKVWINYGLNNLNLIKRNIFLLFPMYIPFKYSLNLKNGNINLYLNSWFFSFIRILFFKLRSFDFYCSFIRIKLNLLLKNLIERLEKKIHFNMYKLDFFEKNVIQISLLPNRLNYMKIFLK